MNERHRNEAVWALSVALVIWGLLLVFENAYFAAPAFGLPSPSWAAWVAQIPLWALNVIDTLAVVAIAGIVILTWGDRRRRRMKGRRAMGTASTVLAWILILIALAVIAFVVFHFTFSDLVADLKGFLGLS